MKAELHGFDELDGKMGEMPNVVREIAQVAMQRGLDIVRDAQRIAVDPASTEGHETDSLANDIGNRYIGEDPEYVFHGKSGYAVGAGAKPRQWYGFLYFLGTGPRKNRRGANRGSMPADDAIAEGLDKSIGRADREMEQMLESRMLTFWNGE